MPTINVPAPPKSAFNKNRPVSDLLQHQLKHFRHIEATLPNELHSNMSARDLHTENGAAKYIAHVTEALRSLHQVSKPAAPAPIPIRRRRPTPVIAPGIAAAAAPDHAASKPVSSRPKAQSAAAEGPASPPARKASAHKTPKHKPRSKKP